MLKAMTIVATAGVLLAAAASSSARAEGGIDLAALPPVDQAPPCDPSAEQQAKDEALLVSALQTFHDGGGFASLKARLPELKEAFSHAPAKPRIAEVCGEEIVVHVESPRDVLYAMTFYATKFKDGGAVKRAVARPSPYPLLGLEIGATYDEYEQWDQSLPFLMRAHELEPTNPIVTTEAALVLVHAHRAAESLAICDETLKDNDELKDGDKARLMRCRGFALEEMKRWDDATAAYKASLLFAPGNPTAQNELAYIRSQKSGLPPQKIQTVNSVTGEAVKHP
jgi:tetratricopeptide (TPR) repeat protein